MKTYIIILHFGDIATTRKCIESLYKNETYPFSLIIVNNANQVFVAKDFTKKKVTVINNKSNLGFAGGVNVGIRYALKKNADIICLLNNDTQIAKPILLTLIKELSEKSVGIVGPAIAFEKKGKKLCDMGGQVNRLSFRTTHKEVENIADKHSKQVTYVSGCCMVIKREVIEKIGFFDESFFLYYEDADFCLRAKINGFATKIVPSVVIHHDLSKSAGAMSHLAIYHLLRSSIIFGSKYAKNTLQKMCNKLFILLQAVLFIKANPSSMLVVAKALLHTTANSYTIKKH